MSAVCYKIIGSDMVPMDWSQAYTGPIIKPETTLCCFLGTFSPSYAYALNMLVIHLPSLPLQKNINATINRNVRSSSLKMGACL